MKLRPPNASVLDARKAVSLKQAFTARSSDVRQAQLSGPATITGDGLTRVTFKIKRPVKKADQTSEAKERSKSIRRLYNAQMPAMACNNCAMSQQCPKFRAGYECAYLPFLNSHVIEDEADLLFYMKEALAQGLRRVQKVLIFEEMSGAAPSIEGSETLAHLFGQMKQLHDTMTQREEASLDIVTGDESILKTVFGGLDNLLGRTRTARMNPIELPMSTGDIKMLEASPADSRVRDENPLMQELSASPSPEDTKLRPAAEPQMVTI